MVKKFFPLDKNYLLEQAQLSARPSLLHGLIERVKAQYELKINPLGLLDSFALKIRNYELNSAAPAPANHGGDAENCPSLLDGFYENLSAIYRFKHGDNQLEFLWDGNDHLRYYQKAWAETFIIWTDNFCKHDLFIQAVLDLTVFLPENRNAQMIGNRMNHFIQKHFEVKILNKPSGSRLMAGG